MVEQTQEGMTVERLVEVMAKSITDKWEYVIPSYAESLARGCLTSLCSALGTTPEGLCELTRPVFIAKGNMAVEELEKYMKLGSIIPLEAIDKAERLADRNSVIEECAKVADYQEGRRVIDFLNPNTDYNIAVRQVAREIRALKSNTGRVE